MNWAVDGIDIYVFKSRPSFISRQDSREAKEWGHKIEQ
jgi:hypothetical protein